jgi:hypothetical protein
MVVRDKSGENTSKGLNDFLTDNGVQGYFNTPYEQWQNSLAESLVGSVTILGKTGMAVSGVRTWRPILVQCNAEWCDLQECNI